MKSFKPALTAKHQFPNATTDALWKAVELLQPDLSCRHPRGDVDCTQLDPAGRGRGSESWCPACEAWKILRDSHAANLALQPGHRVLKDWRPERLDPVDPEAHRSREGLGLRSGPGERLEARHPRGGACGEVIPLRDPRRA